MKRLELSVKIDVPESLFDAASVVSKIKEPWATLLSALEGAGLKFEHHEGQAVAAPVRRGRKPRQVPPVQPPHPAEAA